MLCRRRPPGPRIRSTSCARILVMGMNPGGSFVCTDLGDGYESWRQLHLTHPGDKSDAWQMPSAQPPDQKHFLCTIVGPDSSYSPLDTHICWNVLREERMEPPIQTEYLRSGGATTLIFMVDGASAVSSLVMRSPMPVNMVVPPERTTLE